MYLIRSTKYAAGPRIDRHSVQSQNERFPNRSWNPGSFARYSPAGAGWLLTGRCRHGPWTMSIIEAATCEALAIAARALFQTPLALPASRRDCAAKAANGPLAT